MFSSVSAYGQSAKQGKKKIPPALALSCSDKNFVGVYLSVPRRNSFPDVKLQLIDPADRTVGNVTRKHTIPESHFGEVFELASMPERSKAVATEVCNAKQGSYWLDIMELGDYPYQVSVRVRARNSGVQTAALEHFKAQSGKTRHLRFLFDVRQTGPAVVWLNEQGEPTMYVPR